MTIVESLKGCIHLLLGGFEVGGTPETAVDCSMEVDNFGERPFSMHKNSSECQEGVMPSGLFGWPVPRQQRGRCRAGQTPQENGAIHIGGLAIAASLEANSFSRHVRTRRDNRL